MTDLCQLEGRTLKWQLAYFGPKVGYFNIGFFSKCLSLKLYSCNFGYN